jgi:hypothetical protein
MLRPRPVCGAGLARSTGHRLAARPGGPRAHLHAVENFAGGTGPGAGFSELGRESRPISGTPLEVPTSMAAALALSTVPIIMLAALAITSTSITPLGLIGLACFLALLFGAAIGLLKFVRTIESTA